MKAARVRLIVAIALFAGWLGYLGYLALGHERAVVVSHSQLLVAPYIVKAEVKIDHKQPFSVRVLESFGKNEIPEKEFEMDQMGRLPNGKLFQPHDTQVLLLPLDRIGKDKYKVVAVPGNTGAESSGLSLVYPWSDEVERQVRERLGP